MKKFLKDELNQVQEGPAEALKQLFPKFAEAEEEIQKKSNRWIVILNGKTEDGIEWQVAVQDIIAPHNLYYHLFIFTIDGELAEHIPVQAVNLLPPVSDKTHGIDYFDWLEIQGALYKWLADHNYKVFNIDMNPDGKVVYQTQEKPNEAIEKMKKGESYTIVVIKAPVFLQKLEEWKKQRAENAPRIVTPEQVAAENASAVKIITP
jgi:hypothetical protein